MSISKAIGALVALVSTTCFAVAAAAQTTWYVDVGNCPGPGMGSQEDPFCTIQVGINASTDGDTVIVADGVYTGLGNRSLVFGGKAIVLRSASGPANCIIDCQSGGRGFIFYEVDTPATVVDGFTITNGLGHPGGAIYSYYFSSPTITNCILTGNTGDSGGGGGIYCAMCFTTITNCTISGNTAIGDGGGVYTEGGDPTITNCMITGNTTDSNGGGVYSSYSNPTISNCTITGNTAGTAAGVYFHGESTPTITNSILWGNGTEEIYVDASSTLVVSYSDVQGGWPGMGNIDADPRFVEPASGDFHCLHGSPAIDSADNTAVPPGVTTDLDGNVRFQDDPSMPDTGNPDGVNPIVDMGAYEFQGAAAPIPTVSEWGVIVMILLTLTAGTLIVRPRVPVQAH